MAVDDPEPAGGASGGAEDEEEDGVADMEVVIGGKMPSRRGRCSEGFKEMVLKVLEDNGFDLLRSAKLSQDDFLRLLAVFNAAGIHFS